jgi:hypothetical protein
MYTGRRNQISTQKPDKVGCEKVYSRTQQTAPLAIGFGTDRTGETQAYLVKVQTKPRVENHMNRT